MTTPHNPQDNGSGGQHVVPMIAAPAAMPQDPRSIKARMFSAERKRFRSKMVTFFGEDLEIRQTTIGAMLMKAQQIVEADDSRGVFILMNYAYVPGTDLLVFDDADREQIMTLPYGDDFMAVINAYNEITGVNVEAETKNSETTPSASK